MVNPISRAAAALLGKLSPGTQPMSGDERSDLVSERATFAGEAHLGCFTVRLAYFFQKGPLCPRQLVQARGTAPSLFWMNRHGVRSIRPLSRPRWNIFIHPSILLMVFGQMDNGAPFSRLSGLL